MWPNFKAASKRFLKHPFLPWFESPCVLVHRLRTLKQKAGSSAPWYSSQSPQNTKQTSSILGGKERLTKHLFTLTTYLVPQPPPSGRFASPASHFALVERSLGTPSASLPGKAPFAWLHN